MDHSLLERLVCPVTKSKLRHEGDFLVSTVGGLKYPIKDNIPVLLPDQALLPEGFPTLADFKKQFAPPAHIPAP